VFRFQARLIGGGAEEHLESSRAAKIFAVFRRSFYLETSGGGLACIGPAAICAGPLNVICDLPDGIDWQASGVRPDARISIARGRMVVAESYEFDLGAAKFWRPTTLADDWTVATLSTGLDALESAATVHDLNDGLAALVRERGQGMAGAQKGVDALGQWLSDAIPRSDDRISDPPPDAVSLIGLGPGLTPSGDDLIGGALVALRMFGRENAADCLAGWALPLARINTNKISAAHLAQAARGMGADALHRTITMIADGNDAALKLCLEHIDAIGHSSGWDALAGAVAVMRLISKQ
jgi:hypothetical protein